MEDNLADSEHDAYSYKYMQQKVQEHFGGQMIQTNINGRPTVVTFRSKASAVLQDFYSHQKADPGTDKIRLVETAAKLIWEDIRAVERSHTVYPSYDELGSDECINSLPETLSPDKNCLYWTGNYAGSSTTSVAGTTTGWLGCAAASPFCTTLPHRFTTPSWFLLLLPRSAST